jgi:uncharacterized membrane protein
MLDRLFSLLCHQIPARSPQWQGSVFPVCYRCAGLYGGILCSYVFQWLRGGLRRSFPARNCALAAAAPTAVFLVDAWGNGLGIWNSAGWFRALTGLGAGIAVPILLLPLAGDFADRRASLPRGAELVGPALGGAGWVWLLDHPGSDMIFQSMGIACAAVVGALALNMALATREYIYEQLRSVRSGGIRAGGGD